MSSLLKKIKSLRNHRIKWLTISDFKDYCSGNKNTSYKILHSQKEVTVYPVPFIDMPYSEPKTCMAHEQYVVSLQNAKVIGSSNVVIAKRSLLYDLLKGGKYKITDIGLRWRFSKEGEWMSLSRFLGGCFACYNNFGKRIDSAVSLVGNYSWNFYHYIFEIAQKFYLIDASGIPDDIPLLVDSVVKKVPQFLEILELLKGNRDVVYIEELELCRVRTLFYPSFVHQIPPNLWDINKIVSEDCYFDIEGLKYLRSKFLAYAKGAESTLPFKTGGKIFISRKVSNNRSYNEDELMDIAIEQGYSVVYPEQMTIREQFAMYSQVDSIIAASGAALSNILCCKPGCHILVLASSHWNLTVFSSIAGLMGLDMEYMCGKINDPNNVQSGFVIDKNVFKNYISKNGNR